MESLCQCFMLSLLDVGCLPCWFPALPVLLSLGNVDGTDLRSSFFFSFFYLPFKIDCLISVDQSLRFPVQRLSVTTKTLTAMSKLM